MTEDAWRAHVLFMLKSLSQGLQQVLLDGSCPSAAPTPPDVNNSFVAAEASTSEGSPASTVLCPSSPAVSSGSGAAPCDTTSLNDFLRSLAQVVYDVEQAGTVSSDQLATQIGAALESLDADAMAIMEEQLRALSQQKEPEQEAPQKELE
jgi:hypothetical protein